MDFFRDGGFNMWLLLFAFIASGVIAATRKPQDRPRVLLAGCVLSLILGLLGISTGLVAVANNYHRFPEPLAALATGLRELSNNGLFAAALGLLQGAAALVSHRPAGEGR